MKALRNIHADGFSRSKYGLGTIFSSSQSPKAPALSAPLFYRTKSAPIALSITQAPVLSPKRLCLTTKFGSRHYKGVCDERLA